MLLPRMLVTIVLTIGISAALEAQTCRRGKPCGNTCIARDKICHVGPGTARQDADVDTAVPATREPRPVASTFPAADRATRSAATRNGKHAECVVSRITDGDTFRCTTGKRVRLLLIDAPERDQGPFGAVATRGLSGMMRPGDSVSLELDVEERDRYGRTLAYVYLRDGRMVNEEMARIGLVLVSVYPPNVKHVERIRAAVAEARIGRRGLWSTNAFECAPVDNRRGRC